MAVPKSGDHPVISKDCAPPLCDPRAS